MRRERLAAYYLEDFSVVNTEEFADHRAAGEREIFLKSGQGRKWLDELELKSQPAKGGKSKPRQACAPLAHSYPVPPTTNKQRVMLPSVTPFTFVVREVGLIFDHGLPIMPAIGVTDYKHTP
jgi:hypothetical protein